MTLTMEHGDRQGAENSMHSTDTAAHFIIGGIIFTAFGMIYQFKPDLFRRWFWKRTSIAQRLLSPENYLRYMRVLGVLYIVGGVAALGYGISLLH